MSIEKRIRVTAPMSPDAKVETINGMLTAKEWLKSEKKRIAKANSSRYPKVEPDAEGFVLTATEPPQKEEPQW